MSDWQRSWHTAIWAFLLRTHTDTHAREHLSPHLSFLLSIHPSLSSQPAPLSISVHAVWVSLVFTCILCSAQGSRSNHVPLPRSDVQWPCPMSAPTVLRAPPLRCWTLKGVKGHHPHRSADKNWELKSWPCISVQSLIYLFILKQIFVDIYDQMKRVLGDYVL